MSLGILLAQWILHQPPAAKNLLSMSWDPGTSQTKLVGTLRYKHSYLLKATVPCHYSEDSFSLGDTRLKSMRCNTEFRIIQSPSPLLYDSMMLLHITTAI
jgi:hypothetical protein